MKIVSTSYVNTPEYADPESWLDRISFYTGILEELAKQYQVESIEQINYTGKLKRNGVLYHFLNYKRPKQYFPFKLHRYIKKIKPDIVFVNGFIFPLQTIQLKWKLGKNVKIIVINHAEQPSRGIRKFLQRIADRYVQTYFFTSGEMGIEWVEKEIIAHERKIEEVMEVSSVFNVIDKKTALSRTNVTGNPVFLWVGRLNTNKDPLTVVRAFSEFVQHELSSKLYMIYHTEDLKEEVLQLIQANSQLQDKVIMIGKVSHTELLYWYNSSDFIISASRYEGSGVSVCEAMSCGCIPILTNIPSFRMMTGRGKCGLLYEPGNTEHLLPTLLKTNQMNIEIEREKTLKQFDDELSFPAIAKKITKVIDSIS